MLKKIICCSGLLCLVSCSSTPNNFSEIPPNSKILDASAKVTELCFKGENPQFLSEFSSQDSGMDFQFEGAWESDYNTFTMQVLGVFGEPYAIIKLIDHKVNVFSNREGIVDQMELKNLVTFLSAVGSKQLRKVFCGAYAFREDKTNPYKNNDKDENTFLSKNTMDIDDHSVELQSDIILTKATENEENSNLKIDTKFLAGVLNSETFLQIHWEGFSDEKKVEPNMINFKYGKYNYNLKILDYN